MIRDSLSGWRPSRARGPRRDRIQLASVVFAVLFAQVLLYPGIPDLVEAFGADTALDASMWFLAAEFAAFIAFASLWGAVSDAAGRRGPFIVLGAMGGAVGYAVLGLAPRVVAPSFEGVLLLRALQGAATIGAFSLALTMLMDLPGGHGRNMGAAGIAIGLGTALGAPIGGQLSTIDPFLPLHAANVVLVVAAGLAATVGERPAADAREDVLEALSSLANAPALLVPYSFGFIDRLSAGFFALVGTFYFQAVHHLNAAETGVVLGLFFAPFALLQYPFGVVSDYIGRSVPVIAGSFLYGVTVIGVGLAPTVGYISGLMVVVGIVGAFMAPATMALVTDIAAPADRGAAMGGFNIFGSLGFLAGIVGGGVIADEFGFLAAFVAVGVTEMLLAVALAPFVLGLERTP